MRSIPHILFYIMMLVFCTILVFSLFKSGEIMPLKGHIERVERPEHKVADWFSGNYQRAMDKRTQSKFGFRSVFIRLKNQIDYTFFDEIHAKDVVEGKDGYLYEKAYINAYLGQSFIGEEIIKQKVKKIKQLQDTLAQLNKTIIVILAAGKASFYPNYFPTSYDTIQPTTSNYTYYRQQLLKQQVDFIDFNYWFLQLKDTSRYNLYPKRGIHWSRYGEILVADSILKFIEYKRDVDVPEILVTGIQTTTKPRFSDNDLADGMNLLFDYSDETLAYPDFYFVDEGKVKLNALIVADSFYWGLHNLGFSSGMFKHASFWFYNNDYYTSEGKSGKVSSLELLTETLNSDVIILMATEATLDSFAWQYINLLTKTLNTEIAE